MVLELILIAAAVAIVAIVYWFDIQPIIKLYRIIATARTVAFGAFAVLFAIVLIMSGNGLLMTAGFGMLVFILFAVVIDYDIPGRIGGQ